jgi:phenylacetate-CoA ligase
MVRFMTGDMVNGIAESYECPCGRTLSRFKGFQGRVGDIIKVKGVCVSVAGIENVIRGIDGCSDNYEYHAVDDGERDKVVVQVEPANGLGEAAWPSLRTKVEKALREAFMINMDVEVLQPGTIPLYELKAKRFHDLRSLPAK